MFDGVQSDLKSKHSIHNKKDLYIYCYRVAGTVGLMMAKILQVKDRASLYGAIDLGIAMQLTNIARDVNRIKNHPLVSSQIKVYGYIYDVRSGNLIAVA